MKGERSKEEEGEGEGRKTVIIFFFLGFYILIYGGVWCGLLIKNRYYFILVIYCRTNTVGLFKILPEVKKKYDDDR